MRKVLGINWCNTKFSLSSLAYNPSIFYPSNSLRESGRRDLDVANTLIIGVTGKFLDYKRIDVVLNSFSRSCRSDLLLIVKGKFKSYDHFDMLRKKYSHISNIILVHDFLSTEMLNKFYNMCDFMLWTYPTKVSLKHLELALRSSFLLAQLLNICTLLILSTMAISTLLIIKETTLYLIIL